MEVSLHMYVPVANLTYNLRFARENGRTVLPILTQIDKLFNLFLLLLPLILT